MNDSDISETRWYKKTFIILFLHVVKNCSTHFIIGRPILSKQMRRSVFFFDSCKEWSRNFHGVNGKRRSHFMRKWYILCIRQYLQYIRHQIASERRGGFWTSCVGRERFSTDSPTVQDAEPQSVINWDGTVPRRDWNELSYPGHQNGVVTSLLATTSELPAIGTSLTNFYLSIFVKPILSWIKQAVKSFRKERFHKGFRGRP